MRNLYSLLFLLAISQVAFSQMFDCPDNTVNGLPANDIYSFLASNETGEFISAQSFINFDEKEFRAVQVVGFRHKNWAPCEAQNEMNIDVEFWTYENLLPGELIEVVTDSYVHIEELETWQVGDTTVLLERYTITFDEPRTHDLGFVALRNRDDNSSTDCSLNWLYNHPDAINQEGATVHDDGTKVIWNAFNFCLLQDGISSNVEEQIKEPVLSPNPVINSLLVQNADSFSQIEIFNPLGSRIYSKLLDKSSSSELDVSNFENGIYWVKFTGNSGSNWTEAFIKID